MSWTEEIDNVQNHEIFIAMRMIHKVVEESIDAAKKP